MMNKAEKKHLYYQIGLSLGLVALVVLQFMLVRQAWEARNQEFDLQMGAAMEQLKDGVEKNYYCFELYTEVEMAPKNRMFFLTGGDALDTVREFRFTDANVGPEDGDGVYPLNEFTFSAPIHAKVQLNFDFLGSDDYPQVRGDSAVAWIDEAYEHTIRDNRTGFRVIDSLGLQWLCNKTLNSVLDSGSYAVQMRRSEDDSLIYAFGVPAVADEFYRAEVYDEPPFGQPYKLLVFVPDKEMMLLGQVGLLIGALAIVLLAIAILFVQFSRLLTRQAKLADSKNEFINNMTHEFKTPIANIRLAVDTLSKRLNGQNTHEDILEAIRDENNRMNSNVDTILNAAAMTENQILYHIEGADVDELVESAIAPFLNRLRGRGVLDVSLGSNANVEVDRQHVRNVLQTLLDNAIKYAGDGGVHILIRTKAIGKHVEVSITDKGIGMSEYELSRIFEKFYRAGDGNIHSIKGFGLGLFYARQVMVDMGGEIKVQSAKGSGTTFTLMFPVRAMTEA